jgi:hypothetical protein
MDETRETHERHTIEETAPAAAAEEAAETAVDTAAAAVALAESTAAAAELDAAERVRDYAAELDECRSQIESLTGLISASATADSERERALAERLTQLESSYAARLESLENHPRLSRHHSEGNPGTEGNSGTEVAGVSGEAAIGGETGAEAAARLGPVEASLGGSVAPAESETSRKSAPARRRRRWI